MSLNLIISMLLPFMTGVIAGDYYYADGVQFRITDTKINDAERCEGNWEKVLDRPSLRILDYDESLNNKIGNNNIIRISDDEYLALVEGYRLKPEHEFKYLVNIKVLHPFYILAEDFRFRLYEGKCLQSHQGVLGDVSDYLESQAVITTVFEISSFKSIGSAAL